MKKTKRTGGSTPILILLELLEFPGTLNGVRPLEGLNGAGVAKFCGRRLGLYAF